MTPDELKRELEAFTARIDMATADAIREVTEKSGAPWPGHGYTVQVMLPTDKSARPATGYMVTVALSAWVAPLRYTYEGDG